MSENSVGKGSVSGVLCQREAELVRCGALESSLDLNPGSNSAFAKRPLSVLTRFRIENGNSGLIPHKVSTREGKNSRAWQGVVLWSEHPQRRKARAGRDCVDQ